MEFWNTILSVLNFFLLAGLIYLLFRLQGVEKVRQEDRNRVLQMGELRDSLNQLLNETWEASETLGREIERYRDTMQEMESVLERERLAIDSLLRKSRIAFGGGDGVRPEEGASAAPDKYSEAIRLSQTGLSAEEISRRMNLPLGEVELALQLRK